ncbi:hypothetical protein [Lysinibacillus sp. CTST325]
MADASLSLRKHLLKEVKNVLTIIGRLVWKNGAKNLEIIKEKG